LATVGFIATNLAQVEVIESVQLEEPVRDGLAVPTKRYTLGVVDVCIFLVAVIIANAVRAKNRDVPGEDRT